MGSAVAELPPGFRLDELPPGFQVDAPRAAQPGVPVVDKAGQLVRPTAAPREFTIGEKIKGAVETAVDLVAQFTGGTLGMVGGGVGGLAANVAHGDLGTRAGADRVGEAASEGAQRGHKAARGALQSMLGMDEGDPSEAGQAGIDAVGSVMQQAPSIVAAPRGLVGMSPTQATGLRPALGAVGTGARAGVDAAAEAVTPKLSPNTMARAGTAVDAKIPVNVHQVVGNKFLKMLGEAAENVPLSGGASVRKARTENFSAGLARAIDPESTAKVLDDATFRALQDTAGERIGEIAGRTDVPVESLSDLGSLTRRDTPDVQGVIASYGADLARIAEENGGKIPGDVLRKLRTEAQTQERGARASKGDLANALQRLVKKIDDAVGEHAPEADVATLAEARRQYAVSKAIEPLLAKYPTGEFPPSALKAIVTASKEGKRRMARGQSGELGDYARLGTEMLREIATSNTAERNLVFRAATDAASAAKIGFVWPFAAAYNTLGPRAVKAMVEAQRRREAPAPAGPPPEPGLTQGFEDVPQGTGPAPQSPLGDLTPDWSTEAGAGAPRAAEVVPTEGLVPAVDEAVPLRVRPDQPVGAANRGAGQQIPAVEGRPDLPDAMVVGPPAEAAATQATGAAMQAPDAALARRTQMAEVERVRAKAAESPEVAKVLDEHARAVEAKIKADAKKAQALKDAEALRKAAGYTTDPELAARLRKRAEALENTEKVPVGKTVEGNPPTPPVKEPKKPIPKAEATEVPVETIVAEDPSIPVGEATEVVPEVAEAVPVEFEVGKVYVDGKGRKAEYQKDGTWKIVKS